MPKFISFLRGINVGGNRSIPMAELKSLYEKLNFKQVATFIQSGNVIFECDETSGLPQQIEKKIRERYNFDVPVIIRTLEQMRDILQRNPFLKENGIHMDKLHVTFLNEKPQPQLLDKMASISYENDRFEVEGNEVFLYCPDGYGKTKLNNNFFENKLKLVATTRNWNTVKKLIEMSESN
jgi:uncharacterized protein (DUF1697 family)